MGTSLGGSSTLCGLMGYGAAWVLSWVLIWGPYPSGGGFGAAWGPSLGPFGVLRPSISPGWGDIGRPFYMEVLVTRARARVVHRTGYTPN